MTHNITNNPEPRAAVPKFQRPGNRAPIERPLYMYTGQKPHPASSTIRHTQPSLVLRRGRLLLVRLCLVHELPVDVSDKYVL